MNTDTIISIKPLGFMWPVSDPFLFCAHHLDYFPAGKDDMGPDPLLLRGRNIGQDFNMKDGWRMYHGETVPGFPSHPHRGFETVTIVMNGFVDHSDSYGQSGRYGNGDVQWMTAGAGLQHCEMFPLLNQDRENPAELFQVWVNLPGAKKFVKPHFKMLWAEEIPAIKSATENGKSSEVNLIAGNFNTVASALPAPDSWAADPDNEVAIWTIKMDAETQLKIPTASNQAKRSIYFYRGSSLTINGAEVSSNQAIEVRADKELNIVNGNEVGFLLMLQGIPISEPLVQYGPFVMNTESEIQQAFNDFRRTEFGGWPWPRRDQVHPRTMGRFAKYDNGTEEIR